MAKTVLKNLLESYNGTLSDTKAIEVLNEFNMHIKSGKVINFNGEWDSRIYADVVSKVTQILNQNCYPVVGGLPKINAAVIVALMQTINIMRSGYGSSINKTGRHTLAYSAWGYAFYFVIDCKNGMFSGQILPMLDGEPYRQLSQDELLIGGLCGAFLASTIIGDDDAAYGDADSGELNTISLCLSLLGCELDSGEALGQKERLFAVSNVIVRMIDANSNIDSLLIQTDRTRIEPISGFAIASGRYAPVKILMDNCLALKLVDFPGCTANEIVAVEIPQTETFTINPLRKYTEAETLLMQKIPEWYVMNKESTQIAKLVNKTTGMSNEIRNIMLRGPAGTGKTESAKAIASLLGLPYVAMTCSSDTEIFDFFGQSIPDKDGNIIFAETPFIQAIKNGWLVEVQEPTVIAKEGVLVGLNGLLDRGRTVVLPTGEIVKRHPDCVVILTTNVSYSGCNGLNQSVISRMQVVYDIELPSEDEIVNRVIRITGAEQERKVISKMVNVATQINEFLLGNDIDDGICGVREITDWATFYSITGDIAESARHTVLSKATVDPEYRDSLYGLIEAVFG